MAQYDYYGQLNGGATCWLNATYQSFMALEPFSLECNTAAKQFAAHEQCIGRAIATKLARKFFGGFDGPDGLAPNTRNSISPAEIARLTTQQRTALSLLLSIIDSLSTPDTFYTRLWTPDERSYITTFPIALSACFTTPNDLTSRNTSALRLFGAMVLHCAAFNIRPVPEYHSFGEVSSAMFNTIISVLENDGAHVRRLFEIATSSECLCFTHAREFYENALREPSTQSSAASSQLCISVTPHSISAQTMRDSDNARAAFIAVVQTSVDICTKGCHCGIPAVLGIDYHEKFGPIIAIMTDDTIARGLSQQPASTMMYRRDPVDHVCVPRVITIARGSPKTLATYILAAQISQEGGHYTATVSRNGKSAYISDSAVSPLDDMLISPGMTTLFYVEIPSKVHTAPSDIMARSARHAIAAFTRLNSNVRITKSSSFALQSLCSETSIIELSTHPIETFYDFYSAAIGINIILALRAGMMPAGINALFNHRVGAHAAINIARAAFSQNIGELRDEHFDSWRVWESRETRELLRDDSASTIREEFDKHAISSPAEICAMAPPAAASICKKLIAKQTRKPRASAVTSVPASAVTSVPASAVTSVPASAVTSVPASAVTSVPASAVTSVPASAVTSVPASAVTSVPASAVTSVPASAVTSVPASAVITARKPPISSSSQAIFPRRDTTSRSTPLSVMPTTLDSNADQIQRGLFYVFTHF